MTSPLANDSIFANRYRIVRCIAAGGMGAVYEVIHLETERRRALKVMLPHILHSAELRDRFKREAKVAAQVDSEFITDVYDAGVDEASSMPFLVMELLRGEELGKRLERVGRFSVEETVMYLHQTARALDKTHRASIVHRDLKPENLYLTQSEDGIARIKVLDFGIAKLVAEGNTQANATRSLGTPLFMAPEQFNTATKVSPSTDIYALGMIAYTFLVGQSYWHDETKDESNVFAFAVTAMQGPKEPASARAARHGVMLPPAFDAWFARITAPNPTERYRVASEAIADLAVALGVSAPAFGTTGPGGATPPFGQSGSMSGLGRSGSMHTPLATGPGLAASVRTPQSKKSNAGVAIAAIAGAGALIMGAAALWWFTRATPNAPDPVAASSDVTVQASATPTGAPPAVETAATAEPAQPLATPTADSSASAAAADSAAPAKGAIATKPPVPKGPLPTPGTAQKPPAGAAPQKPEPPKYTRD